MRTVVLASFLCFSSCLASGVALAGDPAVPVREVMDATTTNWQEGDHEFQDLFDEPRLGRLYSKDFVEKYRAAAKFPAYDEGTSPFDYDVIVNGQDGCPLQDTAIAVKGPKDGATEVDATFKNMSCAGTEPEYQKVSTVKFLVVEEGGKPVIDDILTENFDDGNFSSLKGIMVEIAKQGG